MPKEKPRKISYYYPDCRRERWFAIGLVIIFNFWAYLYTYKRDAHKFWFLLTISFIFAIFNLWVHSWNAELFLTNAIVYNLVIRGIIIFDLHKKEGWE